MLTFIDFFSGIGGFRLGMEQAGHKCVGHCEIDKYANISYKAIHKPREDEWFATDIRGVEPKDLPEADCYCFGFPCQSFSIAGQRGGFDDTRGTLFFEIMRLAKERQPKILLAENVKGLLSHDEGRTFKTIINTMGELGYEWEYQILNSKNFGVPQNRERVFIVGHLGGGSGRKVFPIIGSNGEIIKQIGNIDQDKRKRENPQTGRIYAVDGVAPCLSTMQGGRREPKILEVRPYLTPDRAAKRQNSRRFKEFREEMFTLTVQDIHGVMFTIPGPKDIFGTLQVGGKGSKAAGPDHKHHRGMCYDGWHIRKLTPKECFRLQGFPDWAFDRAKEAGISDSQLYKQAGNSVTVNVVYEIARRLEPQNNQAE